LVKGRGKGQKRKVDLMTMNSLGGEEAWKKDKVRTLAQCKERFTLREGVKGGGHKFLKSVLIRTTRRIQVQMQEEANFQNAPNELKNNEAQKTNKNKT